MGGSSKTMRISQAPAAAKSHWPVVVGSFLTGVAAMTLMGVAAPTIANARAPQEQAITDAATRAMPSAPAALIEISEAEQAQIERSLDRADQILDSARAASDEAMARLRTLSR
jgi:hypothetical protein